MTRAGRIGRTLVLGYGHQFVALLTGIWTTRLYLARLGTPSYGVWLLTGQVLTGFVLLDFGVVALLPRDVAVARGGADSDRRLREVVSNARWIIALQTPLAALVVAVVWFFVSRAHPDLTGPLAILGAAYVLLFPVRRFAAVLLGLQDMVYLTWASVASWAATTAVSVTLIQLDQGLYSLAWGWVAGSAVSGLLAFARLRRKAPSLFGTRPPWPGAAALRTHGSKTVWISLQQLSQFLLNGTDVIVLTAISGPSAVVAYACTLKLVQITTQYPYGVAQAAWPALGELRGAGDRPALWRAVGAVGQAVLLLSGLFAVAVMAVNETFVAFWIGPDRYGGSMLTAVALLAMTVRHGFFTAGLTAVCFGHERALSIAGVVDGVLTVALGALGVVLFGPVGFPIGSLVAVLLTTGRTSLRVLASEGDGGTRSIAASVAPWAWRFAAAFTLAAAATVLLKSPSIRWSALAAVGSVALYVVAVATLLVNEPLRRYVVAFASRWRRA